VLIRETIFEDTETEMGEFSHGGGQSGHCMMSALE
jgi:hypothetical protein